MTFQWVSFLRDVHANSSNGRCKHFLALLSVILCVVKMKMYLYF